MATGTAPASFVAIPGPAASGLLGANLLQPGSGGWDLRPLISRGFATAGNPTPAWFTAAARPQPGHDISFFERVHVIPREKDFGAVLTEQRVTVEVWNAFRRLSQLLAAIDIQGPAGIEVDDEHGLPKVYPATQSLTYEAVALPEGDPLIDNLVTWVFDDATILGTNLHLTGFRLIPWPFEANFEQPIREKYGYLTDILAAYDGSEQRILLRKVPVGSMTYAVLLRERDAQQANAILYGHQSRPFGVPLWQYSDRLGAEALAGQREIVVDTDDVPYKAGGLVFIWRDPYHWEAQTIQAVEAGRIVTTLDLRKTWPKLGTWVMPLVTGRLSPDEPFTWDDLRAGETEITFRVDAF